MVETTPIIIGVTHCASQHTSGRDSQLSYISTEIHTARVSHPARLVLETGRCAGTRYMIKRMRLPRLALGSYPWKGYVFCYTTDAEFIGAARVHCSGQKRSNLLLRLNGAATGVHGGRFGVSGTPPGKPSERKEAGTLSFQIFRRKGVAPRVRFFSQSVNRLNSSKIVIFLFLGTKNPASIRESRVAGVR